MKRLMLLLVMVAALIALAATAGPGFAGGVCSQQTGHGAVCAGGSGSAGGGTGGTEGLNIRGPYSSGGKGEQGGGFGQHCTLSGCVGSL